ncbi:MAG: hypothetical protein QM765_36245 [Myxococcales bacterium]
MRRLSSCLLALCLLAPRLSLAADAPQPVPASEFLSAPVPQAAPAQPAQPQPAQPVAQPLPPPPPPPPADVPPPPPPPVLLQPDPAPPAPVQPAPAQPGVMQPVPAQPGVMQPVPAQPGVMVPVPTQPAAVTYAPLKMFHWGIGLSGGIGGGTSNFPGSAGFGLGMLNLGARFLIGTRMPDTGGGYLHAGLIDFHLGVRVGVTVGDYARHTLFGPLWKAGGGLDLAYQLLKIRPLQPSEHEKGAKEKEVAQSCLGVAVGLSINYEYFGRALVASVSSGNSTDLTDKVSGGGLRENSFALVGPFIELSTPKYDPVKGKLKQKYMRLMLLAGESAMYQVSLTWGSTF